ncbi:sterol C4-methyl oxidase 1-2 [Actinidia rufa]|uniref:Sterol C4-methyl oxidase 1-2 n=1 Tax=Actinidia rufa TaxID=165716 RepID=A0A7J0G898_9ERIC|nr:sterol C4-methyl oxidase 1-2 [Actinidia rufa]
MTSNHKKSMKRGLKDESAHAYPLFAKYFDGGVRDELERSDDEEEHAHYVAVASEGLGHGELDPRLDFVPMYLGEDALQEEVEDGDDGEHDEEEEDVVTVEEVVRFGGGVVEPERFQGGEGAAEKGLRLLRGRV